MARGIPIPYEQLPKTATNLGGFQKSAGIEGLSTDNSASIRAAGAVAQVDPRGFVVAAQQVGAIGQAIAGEGQAIMAIRLKQNEAISIRKEYEANTSMQMAQDQINSDLELEPDETKWAGIAEKHSTALRDSLLKQHLSPDARDAISMKMDSWQRRASLAVTINSAKRSNDKVKDAGAAMRIKLANQGDIPGALRQAETEHGAGFMSAEELEIERERLKKLAERNKVNQVYSFLLANPGAFLAEPDKHTQGMDAQTRDGLINQARQAKGQAESEEVDTFTDRMADGEFKTLTDLQSALPETMRPAIRRQLEGMLLRSQEPGIKAKLEADAPQNFARFSDAVDGYNAESDPDGIRYAQIVMAVKQAMPMELRGEILGPLYRKRPGAVSDIEPPEPLKSTVRDIITTMFEAEAFGKYKVETPGATQYDKPTIKEDAKAKAAAYAKKGTAMIYMSKWLAANPEATTDKAFEAVRGIIAGNAPSIRSLVPQTAPPAPPSYTPTKLPKQQLVAPWENDLPPEQPGQIDPLIPFYLPEDQQLPE
jgi:hypothetical protein